MFRRVFRRHDRAMAVATEINRNAYTGNNSTSTPYPVTFRFDAPEWLRVLVTDAAGAVTTLQLGVDYTLSGNGTESTGSLKTLVAVPSSSTVTISRSSPIKQILALVPNAPLPAEDIERTLDWIIMAMQDRNLAPGQAGVRAITFPVAEPADNNTSLPIAALRTSHILGFGPAPKSELTTYTPADIAYAILQHFGSAPTAQDVLAAISALAPLRLVEPPTDTTPGQFGQLAILPGTQAGIIIRGLDQIGGIYPEEILVAENGPGYPGTSFYQGFDSIRNQLYELIFQGTPGPNRWILAITTDGGGSESFQADVGFFETPDLATWPDGITMEAVEDAPERVWINQLSSGPSGIPVDWRQVFTASSFLNLPTSDPEEAGELFLDGTALHVSLGPIP
jgi:hypothetical protein